MTTASPDSATADTLPETSTPVAADSVVADISDARADVSDGPVVESL